MGAVLFIVVSTIVVDSALYYNKVHAGIRMAEQSLGGSTYDEALNLIQLRVQEFDTQPITLTSGSKQWTVTPEQVGQIVDIDASVEAAMQVTRKSNLITDLARRLELYFGSENFALVGEVDQTKLDAFIGQITGELDVPPVNQALSIEGDTIEMVEGASGFVVDQEKLRAELMDALFAQSTSQIEIPMTTQAPEVEGADTAEATGMVQTMMSDEVTLTYLAPRPADTTTTTTLSQEQTAVTTEQQTTTTTIPQTTTTVVQTWQGDLTFVTETKTFTRSEIGDLLDFRAEDRDGTTVLVPYISPDKLEPFFSRIEGPMTIPAVDAWFKSNDLGFTCTVVPGQHGKGLDHETTAAALTEAALRTDDRVATALVKDIDPDFTTEDAESMGITTNLGSYETVWEGPPGRSWNVELATKKASSLSVVVNKTDDIDEIDDWSITTSGSLLIAPGEEFDFAKIVGPRTDQAGFEGAVGIENGVYVDGILGGGICQVSTTLFNAALWAGLRITERWNHSIFIHHYPEGADATITGGGEPKNLRFINDTPNYIWIYGWSNGIKTIFTIFGTSDGRRVTSIRCSDPYDWSPKPEEPVYVTDPDLEATETSIAFDGQDAFKYTLTRVIDWPDGHTTSEEWYSEWKAMPERISIPTSTTTTVAPTSPTVTTLATPSGD